MKIYGTVLDRRTKKYKKWRMGCWGAFEASAWPPIAGEEYERNKASIFNQNRSDGTNKRV